MTFTESRQNGLNFVLTCNQIIVHILLWSWLKSNTGVGNNFFYIALIVVFFKNKLQNWNATEQQNQYLSNTWYDINKNLKCEGKKKLQQILIFADSMGSTWAVNHLLAPPCTSWSVAFSGWSSWTTRLPSVTFPWKTGSPLPFFNFEFITGSCELGSEEWNKNCYFGKLV